MGTLFETLPGTSLPVGTFKITVEQNARLARALGTQPADDGTAHPTFAYIAAQRGIGIDVPGLLALAQFDVADGPMLATCQLRYESVLHTERDYRVTGEVLSIERKQGRRAGVFDLLTFEERLFDGDALAATVRNVFVLPRRGEA